MLTQGPAPGPKSIISSLLTFPHLLDCIICNRNVMSIVITNDRWKRRGMGWLIYSILKFLFFLVLLYFVVLGSQNLCSGG